MGFVLVSCIRKIALFLKSNYCVNDIEPGVVVRNNGEYVGFFRAVIHNIISNIPLFITLYFIVFIFFYSSKHPINSISVIFNVFSANIFNIFASIVMFLWVNIPIFLKNKKSIPDIICSTKTESGKADSRFPKIRIL